MFILVLHSYLILQLILGVRPEENPKGDQTPLQINNRLTAVENALIGIQNSLAKYVHASPFNKPLISSQGPISIKSAQLIVTFVHTFFKNRTTGVDAAEALHRLGQEVPDVAAPADEKKRRFERFLGIEL